MKNQKQDEGYRFGWFYGRWRQIYLKLDKDDLASRARQLAEKHPYEHRDRLALRTARAMARKAAATGVVAATPALIPGIGTAVALASVLPEEIYLMHKQCEMVLQIAAVYGFKLDEEERLYEIITLAANPMNAVDVFMTAKYDIRRMAAKAVVQLGRKSAVAGEVGAKAAGRGLAKRLPAIGFLAGGAINYFSFASLGKKAARYYSAKLTEAEEPEMLEAAEPGEVVETEAVESAKKGRKKQ